MEAISSRNRRGRASNDVETDMGPETCLYIVNFKKGIFYLLFHPGLSLGWKSYVLYLGLWAMETKALLYMLVMETGTDGDLR